MALYPRLQQPYCRYSGKCVYLRNEAKIDIVFPVDANAVFTRMNEQLVRDLHARGWHFYKFVEPDVYRLMCSWSTTEAAISDFITDVLLLND